ncbi:MAG TPA: DAK2 domain-containing protein [Actinomycetota bacterium]|nr:DAK2 domain-containing protein [Actinomycetota bacterium]
MSRVLDAGALRQAMVSSLDDLRAARASIDAANVYPVADSDTGTNLVMTMESVVSAMDRSSADPPGIARAVRSGSLVGARGNSGVILAQILRAFADSVEAAGADVDQVARAFKRATELAYDAVLEPAEGTILSVVSAAADAAQGSHDHVADQLSAVARAASAALARTPEQLPRLKEAGVVDAGGMGLVVVLEALARSVGADVGPAKRVMSGDSPPPPVRDEASSTYKYEVQYLLHSDAANIGPLRKLLGTIGDSVAVIGGEGLWRVHVHTDDRERAVTLGDAFGEPSDVEVVDFAEQIRATNARAQQVPSTKPVEQPSRGVRGIPLARSEHAAALVAVVSGSGVARLFEELGAITVDGAIRATATDEALRSAIEAAPTQDVILLPNNEELYSRLQLMKESLSRRITVLRSADVAHGLAAAAAYGDARDTNAAIRDMEKTLLAVRSGSVVVAPDAFDTPAGRAEVGYAVGIAEGAIVKVGENLTDVAAGVASALMTEGREILTVLTGEGVSSAEREQLRVALAQELPRSTIEIHDGGQPLHRYVMAAE